MPKKYVNVSKITRNGRVIYRARLVFTKNPLTGVRAPSRDFYGKTEAEADGKRAAHAKRYNSNPTGKTAFGKFLSEEFLPHEDARQRAGEIGWQHYAERKSRIERFVLRYDAAIRIRSLPIGNVTPDLVDRLFRALLADPNCSARVYNDLRQDLTLALRLGKRALPERWDDYLADVPERKEPKRAKNVFDADAVIAKIRDGSLPLMPRLFVAFIFVMNCRPQDMFALRWTDVDLDNGLVVFQYAAKRVDGGEWQVKAGTKTGLYDGVALPLGSLLTEMLRCAYAARKADGKAFPWVFCREDGMPHTNNTFRYDWPKIKAALALPDGPTFYSIKTLGNSYWLANGVPAAVQARKMRHSTTRMAENDYRTIFPAEVEKAVNLKETAPSKGHK